MPKACANFIRGRIQSGDNLDRVEWTAQASLHITRMQGSAEIWRRFGGGSDRNRALLSNRVNSMHNMQSVQGRINTGYFASC